MKSDEIILKQILESGNVNGMAEVVDHVNKKKSELLKHHTDTVYPIKAPGEKGGHKRYWMTKLTPSDRNHCKPLYAKSEEELKEKIILYYLEFAEQNRTVRTAVIEALGGADILNTKSLNKTGRRSYLRYMKYYDGSLGNIPLVELTEDNVRSALNDVINDEAKVTGKEFSQSLTVLYKLDSWVKYQHIANVLDIRAVVDLWKKVNLTGHHIFRPANPKSKAQAFSKVEVAQIVRYALSNPSYKSLAVALLVTTGIRIGELLALQEKHVYLEDGFIEIRQKEDTKLYVIDDYTKSNKVRPVFLSDVALTVLERLLELRHSDPSDIDFLVLNENSSDGKMHCRAVDDYLRTTIHSDVLGLPDSVEARSPHDCRRTYASLEYIAGTDIYVIQQQMGHSTVSQTWDYIRDVVDAETRLSQLSGVIDNNDIEPAKADNLIVYADYTQKKEKLRKEKIQ